MSLLAVAIQFAALIVVPKLSSMVSSDILMLPVVIFVVCYIVFQFTLMARRKGWLR